MRFSHQGEKIEGCNYVTILQITRSHCHTLDATFEGFSLLRVCALVRAGEGGREGAAPWVESLKFHDSTSFPTKARLTPGRDTWVTTIWQHSRSNAPERGKLRFLKSCLESRGMTKSFCTFGGEKKIKKKNINFRFLQRQPSSDSSLGAFAGPGAFTAVSTRTPQ